LLTEAIEYARYVMKKGYRYEVITTERLPQVVCTMPDGRRVSGKFTIRNDRVGTVTASVSAPKK
jgi:putative hemolysin